MEVLKENERFSFGNMPACITAHLAANADLRLQFGELLLVHYRLLHLFWDTAMHLFKFNICSEILLKHFSNLTKTRRHMQTFHGKLVS